jgi:hypothetical protein
MPSEEGERPVYNMHTLREFGGYLRALWREGKALVMGGCLFAAIAIWGFLTGKSLPVNIGGAALAVTFMVASFSAWRMESRAAVRLQADLDFLQTSRDSAAGYQRSGMVFVDEVPAFVTGFFDDHTSFQA